MKKRDNQMIEAVRYLSCFVILCIHCGMPQPGRQIAYYYGRFAVLFFLLVSGYYSYGEQFSEKCKKKFKQIVLVIMVNAPICIAWNCLNNYLSSGSATEWLYSYLTKINLLNFMLFNRAIFINSVFYYFFMMLYVYAFCICITTFWQKPFQYIYILSAILFLIGYMAYHTGKYEWYHVGNFLFMGIPVFFFGHYLRSNSMIISFFKGYEPIMLFLSVLLTYFEVHALPGTFITIGQLLFAVVLLFFCINNDKKQSRALATLGTQCSMFVMIYHCQIRDTAKLFVSSQSYLFPLVVLALSTSLGILITEVLRRYPFR